MCPATTKSTATKSKMKSSVEAKGKSNPPKIKSKKSKTANPSTPKSSKPKATKVNLEKQSLDAAADQLLSKAAPPEVN